MIFKVAQYLWGSLRFVLLFLCIFLLIRSFIFEPGRVNGFSMKPTMQDGDWFMSWRTPLFIRPLKRGEIVQFYNEAEQKYVVKRIIGLPGEKITIAQGKVFINDQLFDAEPYLSENTITKNNNLQFQSVELQDNEYYMLGDNRAESNDSRLYGPVHRKHILGVVSSISF